MTSCVIFDLDGVIRHYDSAFVSGVEARFGLDPGTLNQAAYEPALLERLTTGKLSRKAWVREIGERTGHSEAATAWGEQPFEIDREAIALSDELRGLGLLTAVLTNGTDTVAAELEGRDVTGHFDAIFNSATIGWAKPDPRAFLAVTDALDVPPAECLFTDDSPSKLTGASLLGMATHLFRGMAGLRAALAGTGVRIG